MSADGTRIGFFTVGTGPGLVVVHGNGTFGGRYLRLARALAGKYTVHVMDRRGRGTSGSQGSSYRFEREFDDVAAVSAATDAAAVFGHSFGGLAVLGADQVRPVPALILYEPPLLAGPQLTALLPAYRTAVGRGDYPKAFRLSLDALELGSTLTTPLLSAMTRYVLPHRPTWPLVRDALTASIAEYEAIVALGGTAPGASNAGSKVVVLGGTRSPRFLRDSTTATAAQVSAEVQWLPSRDHLAPTQAPRSFASAVQQVLHGRVASHHDRS